MVHEMFGIKNNRVDLSKVPGITRELQVSVRELLEVFARSYPPASARLTQDCIF